MQDELRKFFEFDETTEFEFRKIYGFTFVFMTKIIYFNKSITSSEIKPVAIIYEENDEYYLAPLDEVGDIEAIIEEFVKSELLG